MVVIIDERKAKIGLTYLVGLSEYLLLMLELCGDMSSQGFTYVGSSPEQQISPRLTPILYQCSVSSDAMQVARWAMAG